MNKTEEKYSWELEALKRKGKIRDWKFEAVNLRLASNTWYRPDFLIVHNDGGLEVVEIKGFLRDDAAVKFKVAAEIHDWIWKWRMITLKRGRWEVIYEIQKEKKRRRARVR